MIIYKIITIAIVIIGLHLAIYNLFGVRKISKKIIGTALLFDTLILISSFYSFPLASVLLVIEHSFLVYRLGYKLSTAIIGNIIAMVLLSVVDFFARSIPIYPFNTISTTSFIKDFSLTQVYLATLLNLLYWVVSLMVRFFVTSRRDWLTAINNSRFQIFGLFFGFGLYAMFYYSAFVSEISKENSLMISGVFTLSLMIFSVILFLMHNATIHAEKAARKELELAQLATYTENLEYIYTDMRKVRHDFTNVLTSMVGFLDSRDMDGLIAYFSNHVVCFSSQVNQINLNLGILGYIEQSEIKGLLAIKVLKAEDAGIVVNIDITEPVYFKDANTLELCRVIGILMDNAIEAAIASENPSISVGLVKRQNAQMIVIINSHQEEITSIAKLFEKGFSTKGEGRGFGLSNVREIVSRQPKWSIDTEFSDVMFTQIIELAG